MLKLHAGNTLDTILSTLMISFCTELWVKHVGKIEHNYINNIYLLNQAVRIFLKDGANPKENISIGAEIIFIRATQ